MGLEHVYKDRGMTKEEYQTVYMRLTEVSTKYMIVHHKYVLST